MKTNDLIQLLAADLAPRPDFRGRFIAAALAGAGLALIPLLLFYGLRPDLSDILSNWRLMVKFAVSLTLAAGAGALALHLARPEADLRRAWLWLSPAPLILAAAGFSELAATPPESWVGRAMGIHALACLVGIPLIASLPLATTLWALRDGAPAVPAAAGAAAGAMAAGIGSAVYALHCPDDSPLFLAVWYVLAAFLIIAAGRAGGARLLRW